MSWLDRRIREVVELSALNEPRDRHELRWWSPVGRKPEYVDRGTTAHWSFPNRFRLDHGEDFTVEFRNGTMVFSGPTTVTWNPR